MATKICTTQPSFPRPQTTAALTTASHSLRHHSLPCTGALLQLLQPSKAPTGAGATGAAASAATPAGGPGGGGRRALSSSERAALEQLQSYFSALVEELAGAVGALALADFNGWLVGGAGAGEWWVGGGKASHWYMLKSEVGTMVPCVSQPAAA